MKLKVRRFHENAILPMYAHAGDAGMDVFACKEALIAPMARFKMPLGIGFEFPPGYVAWMIDKSGVANAGLHVMGGIIDAGYRGEIHAQLINLTKGYLAVREGQKIAQIVFQLVLRAEIEEVIALSDSARGAGGFGSSGKFLDSKFVCRVCGTTAATQWVEPTWCRDCYLKSL